MISTILHYRGFFADASFCYLKLDPNTQIALVCEHPDNPGTSIKKAYNWIFNHIIAFFDLDERKLMYLEAENGNIEMFRFDWRPDKKGRPCAFLKERIPISLSETPFESLDFSKENLSIISRPLLPLPDPEKHVLIQKITWTASPERAEEIYFTLKIDLANQIVLIKKDKGQDEGLELPGSTIFEEILNTYKFDPRKMICLQHPGGKNFELIEYKWEKRESSYCLVREISKSKMRLRHLPFRRKVKKRK